MTQSRIVERFRFPYPVGIKTTDQLYQEILKDFAPDICFNINNLNHDCLSRCPGEILKIEVDEIGDEDGGGLTMMDQNIMVYIVRFSRPM